ncbi:MAG: P-II family nitrogen regulator [Myxococcaceae bacterium]|nr:P-II family nitrogen regulator [Myxococcaceae bacterium]MCA3015505.1 P-II family nitrogen regulator [Myxococcaceae bacterium]
MKMIIAIIRPERLEAVEEALGAVLDEGDHYRITIDTVEGRGRQEGEVELFRGQQVRVRNVQKTRITICVNDAYVEKTIAAIQRGARTEPGGAVGDGKIFVMPLDEVVRIRTGERGSTAV